MTSIDMLCVELCGPSGSACGYWGYISWSPGEASRFDQCTPGIASWLDVAGKSPIGMLFSWENMGKSYQVNGEMSIAMFDCWRVVHCNRGDWNDWNPPWADWHKAFPAALKIPGDPGGNMLTVTLWAEKNSKDCLYFLEVGEVPLSSTIPIAIISYPHSMVVNAPYDIPLAHDIAHSCCVSVGVFPSPNWSSTQAWTGFRTSRFSNLWRAQQQAICVPRRNIYEVLSVLSLYTTFTNWPSSNSFSVLYSNSKHLECLKCVCLNN